MQRSLAPLILACLAAPQIASAQAVIALDPIPAPSPPIRWFNESAPEPGRRVTESIKSSSWWEPPAGNSEIPRWTIGQTFSFSTAAGVSVSAGLFGRRGDPLPLHLSENATRGMLRAASDSVIDPKTHKLAWDAKFGITSPLWNSPDFKVKGTGEVVVPLLGDRPPLLPASRAFRLGVGVAF